MADGNANHAVRGRTMEIGSPTEEEREYVFARLGDAAIHVPLGLRKAPERRAFDKDIWTLVRGEEVREESIRLHIFRTLDGARPLGFVVDFGWDHPHDHTREIDLAIPDPRDRSLIRYFDSSVIIAQYLFKNRLAKRFRWRVQPERGVEPKRSARQGGRLVIRQEEQHPLTGEWLVTYIYEYSRTDFESLGERFGFDPYTDYADQADLSIWKILARTN